MIFYNEKDVFLDFMANWVGYGYSQAALLFVFYSFPKNRVAIICIPRHSTRNQRAWEDENLPHGGLCNVRSNINIHRNDEVVALEEIKLSEVVKICELLPDFQWSWVGI